MQVQEASSVFAPVYSLNVTAQYRSLFGEGTLFGSCHIIIAVVVTVVATDDGRNTYFESPELSHHGG